MNGGDEMDERKRSILQAIITDYISTAEPIGSRTIARKYDLGISSATIRNEMSDLEMLGFLEQPHASAGRIPSAKGYRFYVDCLLAPSAITEQEIILIDRWYEAKARRLDEVFQETVKILARMTRNVSLILAPNSVQSVFKYMKFLPLDEHRAIVVIVTDTGFVDNKIIDLPDGTAIEDLHSIAEHINNRLSGSPLEQIKLSGLKDIKNDFWFDESVYRAAIDVLQDTLTKKSERVYTGGATQLLEQPEFRDIEKVRNLLKMLEQEQLITDILQSREQTGNQLSVTIGHENKFSGIKDCSIIQATYQIEGQVVGTVAVLGPTRMEYGKIIGVLAFMQNHLGEVLKKYGI